MRDRKRITSLTFYLLVSSITLVLLAVAAYFIQGKGLPSRFADYSTLAKYEDYQFESVYLSHSCFLHPEDMQQNMPFEKCARQNDHLGLKKILLWGDSAAAHLIPGIQNSFGSSHDLLLRTSSGCGAFIGFENNRRPGCKEINDQVLDLIIEEAPETIVIAGWWQEKYNHLELLKSTLERLKTVTTSEIVVIGSVPNWTLTLPRTLINYGRQNPKSRQWPVFLADQQHDYQNAIDAQLKQLSERYGAKFISPMDTLCNPTGCRTLVSEATPIQWDNFHLTAEGSAYLVKNSLLPNISSADKPDSTINSSEK